MRHAAGPLFGVGCCSGIGDAMNIHELMRTVLRQTDDRSATYVGIGYLEDALGLTWGTSEMRDALAVLCHEYVLTYENHSPYILFRPDKSAS